MGFIWVQESLSEDLSEAIVVTFFRWIRVELLDVRLSIFLELVRRPLFFSPEISKLFLESVRLANWHRSRAALGANLDPRRRAQNFHLSINDLQKWNKLRILLENSYRIWLINRFTIVILHWSSITVMDYNYQGEERDVLNHSPSSWKDLHENGPYVELLRKGAKADIRMELKWQLSKVKGLIRPCGRTEMNGKKWGRGGNGVFCEKWPVVGKLPYKSEAGRRGRW